MTLQGEELAALFARLMRVASQEPLDTRVLLATCAESGRRVYGARGAIVQYAPLSCPDISTEGTGSALRTLAADAVAWKEGPGCDARSSGAALIDVDVTTRPARVRWPSWAPRALALGFGRVTALPLKSTDDLAFGALVLLGPPEATMDEKALASARCLAETAAHALALRRQAFESRVLAAQLQTALSSRVVIEQAKGMLAVRQGLTLDDAFGCLRRHARTHRRKVTDLAREVTEGRDDIPPR
ncbi:ANTAR domain-containing protein [Streptomyces alfalfae]|uniref:ANTAR domain-containing protein n=1 Tax=Streptomyces alfalfae TaxID=1642299 RepID=A0A7T4PCB6_9ACTN|nr:ANTAR domain-containing protein [Streptomyces alfalfae]QQC87599.1 ANTAR domain-containing protein [Streptomyces alfalfae]